MRFRKSIVLVSKRYLLSETSRLHTFVTKLLSSTDLICLFPYRYYFYKTRKVPTGRFLFLYAYWVQICTYAYLETHHELDGHSVELAGVQAGGVLC